MQRASRLNALSTIAGAASFMRMYGGKAVLIRRPRIPFQVTMCDENRTLKQAGFSDAEIALATANAANAADGFTDGEIDEEFALATQKKFRPVHRALEAGERAPSHPRHCGEYAEHYFGDEPLGFRLRTRRL